MSFTLEFLFVAKWVVICGEPGGLCLSAWQDRRGEISDGEIGVVRLAMARGPEQREREKETERHERYLIEGERKMD